MNYTKNYHLPQWDETDRIMRTDFNQMCAGLEDGLTTAQAAANAAQQTADAAAVLPYVIGTYTGTGADLSIDVGFRPRFLIISGIKDGASALDIGEFGRHCVITAGNSVSRRVQFTKKGFTVKAQEYWEYPDLAVSERVYDYIAFN